MIDREKWQSYVDSGIYPPRTHTLLDDLYVKTMDGCRRQIHRPRDVSPDPVFRAEEDWEGVSVSCRCNCLLYDRQAGRFKFWYACQDPRMSDVPECVKVRWAHATSTDGIHWERPELGLVEHKGSRKNNLLQSNVGRAVAMVQNVALDERETDPARRYKAIGIDRHAVRPGEITWTGPEGEDQWYRDMGSRIGCGVFIYYSPDGVRWTLKEGWAGSAAIIADGSVLHGFNDDIGKWVMWQRPRIMPKYRTMGISTSKDFETWTFPADILAPDEQDPPGLQFDSLGTVGSPDGGYVGLAAGSGYEGEGFKIAEKLPQLVFSRDGRRWTRVSREHYMLAGDRQSWNGGPCIVPLCPIVVGDEIFVFYYGKNYGNLWGEPTLDGQSITASALGLAKLPRDRWMSITPQGAAGEMITPLVSFAHNELHVNADAAGGSLAVELQTFEHKPIEGFTLADCDAITSDSLDHTVSWRGRSDLSRIIGTARCQPLYGRGLVLRFRLDDARLFTFSC